MATPEWPGGVRYGRNPLTSYIGHDPAGMSQLLRLPQDEAFRRYNSYIQGGEAYPYLGSTYIWGNGGASTGYGAGAAQAQPQVPATTATGAGSSDPTLVQTIKNPQLEAALTAAIGNVNNPAEQPRLDQFTKSPELQAEVTGAYGRGADTRTANAGDLASFVKSYQNSGANDLKLLDEIQNGKMAADLAGLRAEHERRRRADTNQNLAFISGASHSAQSVLGPSSNSNVTSAALQAAAQEGTRSALADAEVARSDFLTVQQARANAIGQRAAVLERQGLTPMQIRNQLQQEDQRALGNTGNLDVGNRFFQYYDPRMAQAQLYATLGRAESDNAFRGLKGLYDERGYPLPDVPFYPGRETGYGRGPRYRNPDEQPRATPYASPNRTPSQGSGGSRAPYGRPTNLRPPNAWNQPVDPATGFPIDPTTGYPVDPDTGDLLDPNTYQVIPDFGYGYAPAGTTIDPYSGNYLSPDYIPSWDAGFDVSGGYGGGDFGGGGASGEW